MFRPKWFDTAFATSLLEKKLHQPMKLSQNCETKYNENSECFSVA